MHLNGKSVIKLLTERQQKLTPNNQIDRKLLKYGMEHLGHKVYEVYINYDPRLTLTYFTARSNLVAYALI